jgi:hypothetical protein
MKMMTRDRWFNYIEDYVLLGALPLNEGAAAAVAAWRRCHCQKNCNAA